MSFSGDSRYFCRTQACKSSSVTDSRRRGESEITVHAAWNLIPGEKYPDQLKELIERSDIFVFVISDDSSRSPECRWELAQAVKWKKWIQTVRYQLGRPPVLGPLGFLRGLPSGRHSCDRPA